MNALDRSSGVPLYRQIKQILAHEIRSSRGAAPVMTEQALIGRFRVSRATVRQALRGLVDDGLIYRERAKGTFPVERMNIERPATLKLGGIIGYLADQGLEPVSEVRDVERVIPPAPVREALLLADGEATLTFTRRILTKNRPLSLARIHLRAPEEFMPSAAELEAAGSAMALLERTHGTSFVRAEHHVWAAAASGDEAAALEAEPGHPVLTVESVMFTREGRPGAWRRIVDRSEEIKHIFTSTIGSD